MFKLRNQAVEFEGLQHNRKVPSLTPLIDIVFLLLVFFMLTAHFVKDEVLDISLPDAESALQLKDEKLLEVLIKKGGVISINKEIIAKEKIYDYFQEKLPAMDNKQVILRGDTKTELGLVVSIMDAARKAGAKSLDIVTQQP